MRVLTLLLLPLLLGAAPQEERGREIYLEGAGEITAVIAAGGGTEGGTEVPASALPCASCHGRDGRGRSEGGV
ncbi:MAG TPA: ABC transporter substrate-binding protein, partial [Thermoanaerobaculia bacterium]|nr:ABC transporter substrate-binding protein [Thermoanaerobaculia bacterium]